MSARPGVVRIEPGEALPGDELVQVVNGQVRVVAVVDRVEHVHGSFYRWHYTDGTASAPRGFCGKVDVRRAP